MVWLRGAAQLQGAAPAAFSRGVLSADLQQEETATAATLNPEPPNPKLSSLLTLLIRPSYCTLGLRVWLLGFGGWGLGFGEARGLTAGLRDFELRCLSKLLLQVAPFKQQGLPAAPPRSVHTPECTHASA